MSRNKPKRPMITEEDLKLRQQMAMMGQNQAVKQQMQMEEERYVRRFVHQIAKEVFLKRMEAYTKTFEPDDTPSLDDVAVIAKDSEMAAVTFGLTLGILQRTDPSEETDETNGSDIIVEE